MTRDREKQESLSLKLALVFIPIVGGPIISWHILATGLLYELKSDMRDLTSDIRLLKLANGITVSPPELGAKRNILSGVGVLLDWPKKEGKKE